MTFNVTIFNSHGTEVLTAAPTTENAAWKLAEEKRPPGGASYIHAGPLKFRAPYRRNTFATEQAYYCGTSTRRLSNLQIEAAAKRFEMDGEHDNAANIRELMK